MSKSHVSMEAKVCPCCGNTFSTNSILLDRRLRPSMDRETITGYDYCEACKEKFAEGYLGLVEALNPIHNERLEVHQAHRTGRIAWLRKQVAKQLFNIPLTDEMKFVFVDGAVIDKLEGLRQQADAAPEN
jgi:hypothetical protein